VLSGKEPKNPSNGFTKGKDTAASELNIKNASCQTRKRNKNCSMKNTIHTEKY